MSSAGISRSSRADPWLVAADLFAPTDPDLATARRAQRSLKAFCELAWPVIEPGTPFIDNWHLDAICEHLEAVTRGEIPRLLINIPPRHMKPVRVDALVLMADGSRRRLGDIEVGDKVIGHSGRACTVSAVHEQGELDTLCVTTTSGRATTTAPDHPFLTPEGWVDAGDLRLGAALATVPTPRTSAASDHPSEAFALAGYIAGDGCVTPTAGGGCASNITCHDPIQGQHIIECVEALGYVARWSTTVKRLNLSGGVRQWLADVGLAGLNSHTKRVPEFVYRGGPAQIAWFLGAYFACDGTLNQRHHKRKDLGITFNSVSRDLLSDVQHLLLRIGVRSRLRPHTGGGYKGPGYRSWRLTITSQDDTAKFIARVPVIGAKAERLAAWGIQRGEFDRALLPDTVESVEPAGRHECCCLTVEGDHSFTADDLVVKNSSAVSVMWPAWEWLQRPESKWMFASYGQNLAFRDSLKCRRLIMSRGLIGAEDERNLMERVGYQGLLRLLDEDWELTGDQNTKGRFENSRSGYRISSSVDGLGTGEGGNRVVADDPHKVKETESEVQREAVLEWWFGTMSSRLNQPSEDAFVVIMQRIHEGDLSGAILERGNYTHLCLPAEYEPQHPFLWPDDPRTEPGEPLWPARYGPQELAELKEAMGSAYTISGQLQQLPSPSEGGIFKRAWWRYYPPSLLTDLETTGSWNGPTAKRIWQSWDTALKEKTTSDWTVGQVWLGDLANRYLLREVRGRWSLVETIEQVRMLNGWVAKRFPQHGSHPIFVENTANGPEIMAALRHEIAGLIPVKVSLDKIMRAEAITPQIQSGNVYLPGRLNGENDGPDLSVTPPWVQALIDEAAAFPNGANDDRVDALTQALDPRRFTDRDQGKVKDRPRPITHRLRAGDV